MLWIGLLSVIVVLLGHTDFFNSLFDWSMMAAFTGHIHHLSDVNLSKSFRQ